MSEDTIAKDLATGTASNLMDTLAAFAEETGGAGSKAVSSMYKLSAITINLVSDVPGAGDTDSQIKETGKILTTYWVSEAITAGVLAGVSSEAAKNVYMKIIAAAVGGLVGLGLGMLIDGVTETKEDGSVVSRDIFGNELAVAPADNVIFRDYNVNKSVEFSYDQDGKIEFLSISDAAGNKGYRLDKDRSITAYDKENGILATANINDTTLPENIQNIVDDIEGEVNHALGQKLAGMTIDDFISPSLTDLPSNLFGRYSPDSLYSDRLGIVIGEGGIVSINAKTTAVKTFPDGSSLTTYYDPETGKLSMLATSADGTLTFYYPDDAAPSGLFQISFSDPSELPFSVKGLFDSFLGHVADDIGDQFSKLPVSALPEVFGILPEPLSDLIMPDIYPINHTLPAWFQGPADGYGKGPSGLSPLVLDLDGDGIEVTQLGWGADGSHVYFDLNNDQFIERTAWVTGGDGLLAFDGNGKVNNLWLN